MAVEDRDSRVTSVNDLLKRFRVENSLGRHHVNLIQRQHDLRHFQALQLKGSLHYKKLLPGNTPWGSDA